jgi:hypothetical protein
MRWSTDMAKSIQEHREADDGKTIVDAIRRERAEQIRQPKTADTHGSPL